jgi:hypothetical protein
MNFRTARMSVAKPNGFSTNSKTVSGRVRADTKMIGTVGNTSLTAFAKLSTPVQKFANVFSAFLSRDLFMGRELGQKRREIGFSELPLEGLCR